MRRRRGVIVDYQRQQLLVVFIFSFYFLFGWRGKRFRKIFCSQKPGKSRRQNNQRKRNVQKIDGKKRGGGNKIVNLPLQRAFSDFKKRLDDNRDNHRLKSLKNARNRRKIAVGRINIRKP